MNTQNTPTKESEIWESLAKEWEDASEDREFHGPLCNGICYQLKCLIKDNDIYCKMEPRLYEHISPLTINREWIAQLYGEHNWTKDCDLLRAKVCRELAELARKEEQQ